MRFTEVFKQILFCEGVREQPGPGGLVSEAGLWLAPGRGGRGGVDFGAFVEQRQKQTRIPFGNDKQRSRGKRKFPAGMTERAGMTNREGMTNEDTGLGAWRVGEVRAAGDIFS